VPVAAHAHGAVTAALALGAFATFAVLTAPFWAIAAQPTYVYPTPVYAPAQPVYSYSAPPAPATPAVQREVIYPHGRHVLYGDGVTTAYRWVWVPNPPPPPPPALTPPPAAAPPPPAATPPPTR
jgi:hypothetical protein